MSENKEKMLPEKDSSRDGEERDGNNSRTGKVTADEKAESADVFGEDEVKTYTPEKKASDKKAQAEKTMLFKKLDESAVQEDDGSGKATGDTLSNTRYFNLRSKGKNTAADKNRKNLMQNFRVLKKNREDRAILEAAPAGDGGRGFADRVRADDGEDIFEAVEKAYNSKREQKKKAAEKKSLRDRRNEAAAEKGAQMAQELQQELSKHEKGMLVYGVLFAVSLITTLFFADTVFYAVLSLVISLAALVLSFPVFEKSFRALKNFNAVSDTAVAVMCFFTVLHNICILALGQRAGAYTLCVIFAFLVRICSSWLRLKNKQRLVSMALSSKSLSILQRIPVKKDAASFTRKIGKNGEPDIFYCTRAMLDTSLEEPESENIRENKYFVFTMSFVLLCCVVVGLSCFAVQMTGMSFIAALTATACALLPIMYDPVSRLVFYRKGKEMLEQGACISGREALTHIGASDGFVLEAKDVFCGEVSRFRKSAISKISQNDSAVFAALLIREADSVLAPCFDSFLEQMDIDLPPVENFLYEERLGYSAWVLDRKVLVGNRQMLLNHSVSVPSKEQEKAYGQGRYVMYVVIDGEITATFLVGYKVLSSLRKYSRDFNKTGLVIMLNSKEAFLDEAAVAAKLSVDASSVKILSSKATAIMEKYNSRYEKQIPTGLLCSGSKRSLMHLIMGCYNANASDRFILIMMLLGQLLGFIALMLAALLNMKLFFNPVCIVALRLLWSLITALIIEKRNK